MQEYYNSISNVKRIAFIDNLTDNQAKELSKNRYPNAVCFASNTTEDKPFPVIWYNGARYGFTNVDKTLIQIGNITFGLTVDDDGVLRLIHPSNERLIYIGNGNGYINVESIPNIVTSADIRRIKSYTQEDIYNTWFICDEYDFNDKQILLTADTFVILPSDYDLCIPMYTDESLTNPIHDDVWVRYNDLTYSINGNSYYIWKLNTEVYGNLISSRNIRLLSKLKYREN